MTCGAHRFTGRSRSERVTRHSERAAPTGIAPHSGARTKMGHHDCQKSKSGKLASPARIPFPGNPRALDWGPQEGRGHSCDTVSSMKRALAFALALCWALAAEPVH